MSFEGLQNPTMQDLIDIRLLSFHLSLICLHCKNLAMLGRCIILTEMRKILNVHFFSFCLYFLIYLFLFLSISLRLYYNPIYLCDCEGLFYLQGYSQSIRIFCILNLAALYFVHPRGLGIDMTYLIWRMPSYIFYNSHFWLKISLSLFLFLSSSLFSIQVYIMDLSPY